MSWRCYDVEVLIDKRTTGTKDAIIMRAWANSFALSGGILPKIIFRNVLPRIYIQATAG